MIHTPLASWCWRALPGWGKRLILWLSNAHFVVGAVAVVHDGNGRVLVARHTYRAGPPWGLPGGWVRRGEDPAETVAREIREETALEVEVTAPLTVQVSGPGHLTLIYKARLIGGTFQPSGEVPEVRFLERGTWPAGMRADHRALIETYAFEDQRVAD